MEAIRIAEFLVCESDKVRRDTTAAIQALSEKLTQQNSQLNEKLTQQSEKLTEQNGLLTDKITELDNRLSEKLTDKFSQLDSRLTGLESTIKTLGFLGGVVAFFMYLRSV